MFSRSRDDGSEAGEDLSACEGSIGSARVDAVEGVNIFVTDPMAAFAAAEAKLTKALSSVADHARAHMWLGLVDMYTMRAVEGIAECEHALELDRNLAGARSTIGFGKILTGRAEETEAHIIEALRLSIEPLRLSPRDTMAYVWMNNAGVAKNFLCSCEQAVAWFRRAIEANRNYPLAYLNLAAALALLGRLDEAHSAVKAGLALNPNFSISRGRAAWTAMSDDSTFLATIEPVLEGTRKAGVPEQ